MPHTITHILSSMTRCLRATICKTNKSIQSPVSRALTKAFAKTRSREPTLTFGPRSFPLSNLLLGTLLLFGISAIASAQSSVDLQNSAKEQLSSLPPEIQDYINTECLPAQYNGGASAFGECVAVELNRYELSAYKDFDTLQPDDKYAIQQTCQPLLSQAKGSYSACLDEEINALQQEPEPVLTSISTDEQFALRQSCFSAQTKEGALAYRKCLNTELAKLSRIQPVSMAGLSSVEKNSIQLGCSPSSKNQSAAHYRLCLAQSLESILKAKKISRSNANEEETVIVIQAVEIEKPVNQTTVASAANNIQSAPAESAQEESTAESSAALSNPSSEATTAAALANPANSAGPRIILKPQNVSTGNSSNSAVQVSTVKKDSLVLAQQTTQTGNDSGSESSTDLTGFLAHPAIGKYGPYLATLLPVLLLFALWRLISMIWRAFSRSSNIQQQASSEAPDYRNTKEGSRQIHDDDQSLAFDDHLDTTQEPAGFTTRPDSATTQNLKERVRADMSRHRGATLLDPDIPLDNTAEETLAAARDELTLSPVYEHQGSEFGQWLSEHNVPDQKKYCIEFMLYWVSYGEGKYDPLVKAELLKTKDLSDHDLIKKRVLLKDSEALISALGKTRTLFDAEEMEQIINLMFAVLVEHSASPTQNVFFRFLADFIGLGADGLARKYQNTFGAPLPPVPRPDDTRWWNKRKDLEELKPNMAQSEREVMLNRLGLEEPAKESDIDTAYANIAKRFAPERFDLLGEKEQQLARRHLANYKHAHESLFGVTQ